RLRGSYNTVPPLPCLSESFFFQAEDGIRDRNVTGVQTCALPIYDKRIGAVKGPAALDGTDAFIMQADGRGWLFAPKGLSDGPLRSEERRVGKECRLGRAA